MRAAGWYGAKVRASCPVAALVLTLLAVGLSSALTSALAQGSYGDSRAPVAGRVLGTTIRTQDAEALRDVILKRLTDRYATEKGIAVTQAEKDAYNKAVQDRLRQDRAGQAARRDGLQRGLAAQGLSDAERKSLAAELDAANRALEALAEPAGKSEEIKAARDQIADAFIRQWKINQALYRQYGGRVIYQQGGPEPLDAYRKFLEEAQAQGDFSIVNKQIEAAFWRYYVTDSIHAFFSSGSKEEAQAFDTPPWLSK